MKKTLTQEQIADYEQLCCDRNNGRILTPNGLKLVCEACDYNAEKIGEHFLELLPGLLPKTTAIKGVSYDRE